MLGICFVIASISAVSCAVPGQDEITLISPDKPEPVIVIGVGVSPSENYAAQEMATYLGKITGRKITILDDSNLPKGRVIIALGRNKLTESIDASGLDCEQFITDIQPDRLIIIGGRRDAKPGQGARDAGTLYGVYEFLDGLGVRWYRPEDWGVHVPRMPTINLTINRTISPKPSYNVRAQVVLGMGVFREETLDQLEETWTWLARNRGNVYCRTGDAARDALLDARVGGGERYSWTHAYGTIVPKTEFFESHPEYFSLVKGKREPVDLCLGNPELQKVFTERLIATAKQDPLMSSVSVDPDDARGHTCECELCKAMDLPLISNLYGVGTNRVVAFNNKVAEAAAKEVPWVKVGWLAYSSHTAPPTNISRLAPNTIITIAPINRLNDWRMGHGSRSNANLVKMIREWALLKPYTMQVYEYYAGYSWPGPTPFTRSVADRWRNYRKLGITGIYNETTISWGPQGLDNYMSVRLAWNPDMDVEKELNLYYKNYYGPAENPMRAYHDRLMKALETAKYPVRSGGQGMHLIFTPALVNQLGVYIHSAQELVKDQPLYERRLRGVALGYEFARRVSNILVLRKKTGVLTEVPGTDGRGSYYKSEEARKAYGDLVRWVRSVNTEDFIFDLSRRFKVDASEIVFVDDWVGTGAGWLHGLPLDILTNRLHPTMSEEVILADF